MHAPPRMGQDCLLGKGNKTQTIPGFELWGDSPEARREPRMGLGGHSGQRRLAARGCGT